MTRSRECSTRLRGLELRSDSKPQFSKSFDGSVKKSSREGSASTISSRGSVPCALKTTPDEIGELDTSEHIRQELEKPQYLFLIVDDSNLNRKMMCKLVMAQGHLCEMAEDGLIAIEQVQRRLSIGNGDKTTYDAILMDFVMPNMDGPTATKQIRELGYNGLIFGVTGNALQSDLEYFKNSGANEVLVKPLDIQVLNALMLEGIAK
eukprot:CAMPEP_0119051942 /NCGR_PEP_ID=MMETSP1177-20130426/73387_1 /TAXON_ID=2985 /ORGANISM="Ochromonas sp, Strain CCMP1899" /LENGTH=205 /DNA_ID=CAMNT_0007031315 /DNA_START=714 /DNA_END=1331 /DNA_ORIENTATION=-